MKEIKNSIQNQNKEIYIQLEQQTSTFKKIKKTGIKKYTM